MSNILVVADLPANKPVAISRAVELALAGNKTLHIVCFCYQSLRYIEGDETKIKQAIIASVKLSAEETFKKLIPKSVEFTFEVVWEKRIHEWIDRYAKDHTPAMVVKTTHRSETFLYTPTDWHLLRDCSVPVFLVNEEKWHKKHNVLAAVDLGSKQKSKLALNHQILTEAQKFSQAFNAEIHVCYTLPFSTFLCDLGMQYKDEIEIKAEQRFAKLITDLSKEYDIPLDNFHLKAGEPEKVIPSTAAKHKAGLVIIGTVGRKRLKAKVLGNTAEKILTLLKSDVLALKPE